MAGHANHTANAAAWAAMRAEQAAAMERRRAERAAEKAARREANRAAWWSRYGLEAPGSEAAEEDEATEAVEPLEVPRCKVNQVTPAEWHVTTSDGIGYSYTVEDAVGLPVRTTLLQNLAPLPVPKALGHSLFQPARPSLRAGFSVFSRPP